MTFRTSVATRGPVGAIYRLMRMARRFGPGSGWMEDRVSRYADLAEGLGCPLTLPVTGMAVGRHPDFFKDLSRRNGIELAVHGHNHIPLAEQTPARQREEVVAAVAAFKRAGVDFKGFRAPYLSWNAPLVKILGDEGFTYDFSPTLIVDVMPGLRNDARTARVVEHYERFGMDDAAGAGMAPVRFVTHLPDDEIITDRLGMRRTDHLARALTDCASEALSRSGHFTAQLHPERFDLFKGALVHLVEHIRGLGADCVVGSEFAQRLGRGSPAKRPAFILSGDIDMLSIADYLAMR